MNSDPNVCNMSYKLASESAEACSLCNSTSIFFDSETSEAICSSCGMVVKDNIESMGPEWRAYLGGGMERKRREGRAASLAFFFIGVFTFFSYSKIKAKGVAISAEQRSKVQRMRRWNKISSNNRSYHRNLKNAFAILSTIKDKLSLSDTLIEKAAYNYRKALDKRIIKGRSIRALIVAAVYASCRDLSVPRTLEEISSAANTDPIFAGKCYRLLVQHLELQLPVIDSNKYLAKIANKAKVSEKTYRSALEMLSAIKNDPISHGKDPNALAVAVLYAACLKEGENVSQAQIAVSGDISIVTLRKRFQDVRKTFSS